MKSDSLRTPHKRTLFTIILVLILAIAGLKFIDLNIVEEDFFLGGIQVNEPDHKEWISVLKEVGMNTVSVTVYARQGIWNSDNIWWKETEEAVINEIKTAKAQGMKVVLIPRVTLDHYFEENSFLWHGMTMPKTDILLTNWFKWYTVFIDKWAHVCEEENVDVLAVGSELRMLSATQPVSSIPDLESFYLSPEKQKQYISDRMFYSDEIPSEDLWVKGKESNYATLEKYLYDEVATKVKWAREVAYADEADPLATINERRAFILDKWYKLIKKVRTSYSGKLTYAANFDNYQNVKFWDKLDFIGINAYFKLRDYMPDVDDSLLTEKFEASWDDIFLKLKTFRKKEGLDQLTLFTELGYVYKENSTIMPWEGFGFSIAHSSQRKDLLVWSQQKKDKNERHLAVEALNKTNKKYNLLKGILYWKLTTKEYHIPYEPFVLHIQKSANDPMQNALVKFLD